MSLNDILTALKAGGARFQVDVSPDPGNPWRATLQNPQGEGLVEQGNLVDLNAVAIFFREQAAIHYPNIVLP